MKELVQGRDIAIRTYDLGEGRILVEGNLMDRRFRPRQGESFEGEFLVHDMIARLTIRGPEMVIEEADAEMPGHPRDGCEEAVPWIRRLIGERIVSGFTQRVKDLLGNEKGCAHLTSLVITMGPAAVQGYWAAYGVGRSRVRPHDPRLKWIINTCHMWREGGPILRELEEKWREEG